MARMTMRLPPTHPPRLRPPLCSTTNMTDGTEGPIGQISNFPCRVDVESEHWTVSTHKGICVRIWGEIRKKGVLFFQPHHHLSRRCDFSFHRILWGTFPKHKSMNLSGMGGGRMESQFLNKFCPGFQYIPYSQCDDDGDWPEEVKKMRQQHHDGNRKKYWRPHLPPLHTCRRNLSIRFAHHEIPSPGCGSRRV